MKKRLLIAVACLLILSLAALYFCNKAVDEKAGGKLYSSVEDIPFRKVGLLLGTAKTLQNGLSNLYYTNRIAAAAALIKAGKIRYFVISGDNSQAGYNEPEDMRRDLIAAGVDSTIIFLDYAGFRTFDSVVRLREVFGQDNVTVISQPFHNERAIYIASREGINAIGYNAKDVSAHYGFKTQTRERFARVKLFLDYLFNKKPKFLGPKVPIPS